MTIDLTPEDCQLAIYALESAAKSSEQHARNAAIEGAAVTAHVATARACHYRSVARKLHDAAVRECEDTQRIPVLTSGGYDANGSVVP